MIAEFVGYALPFWIVLVLLVGVLIWLQFAFAETLPATARRATPLLRSLAGLSQVVTDERLRRNYLGNFLVFVAAFGFWRLITIYLVDEWGLSVGPVTACYAALAVLSGLGNLVLMPRLVGRVAMGPLALVTLLVGAVSMAAVVVPYELGVPGSLAVAVALGVGGQPLHGAVAVGRGRLVVGGGAGRPAGRRAGQQRRAHRAR